MKESQLSFEDNVKVLRVITFSKNYIVSGIFDCFAGEQYTFCLMPRDVLKYPYAI